MSSVIPSKKSQFLNCFEGKELWKANQIKPTWKTTQQLHDFFASDSVSYDRKKDMKHNDHADHGVVITAECWVQDYHILWAPTQ